MRKHESIIKQLHDHAQEFGALGVPKSLSPLDVQDAQDKVTAAGIVSKLLHCVGGYYAISAKAEAGCSTAGAIRKMSSMIVTDCLSIMSPAITLAVSAKDGDSLEECLYDLHTPVVAASVAHELRESMGTSHSQEEVAARVSRRVEYVRKNLSEITDIVMRMAFDALTPSETAGQEVYTTVANLYVAASEFRRSAIRDKGLSQALSMILARRGSGEANDETRH